MSELRQALLSEASSLLSSVRRNPSWAASELGAAAPAIVGLEAMRHRLMDHRAGPQHKSSQLALLLPLLDVVRSAELSAPFTTCALHALHRIVLQKLVRRDAPDARPALAAVVAAVTKCQFETTDTDNNELAISAVFAVLLSTLRTSAALLDDAAVGEMVQACFRLNQRQVPISALLRGQAEATFVQLAHAVFAGLLDLHDSDAPPAYETASASAGHSVAVVTTAAAAPLPPPSAAQDSHIAAGLPCIEKLLRFLCHELRKPLPTPSGGADTPRRSAAAAAATTHSEEVSNALAPKLLCLTALIHGLGDMREELSLYPTLMACVGDDMCEALLQLLRFCAAEALAVDGGSTDQLAQVGQAAAAEMAELQAGVLARCLQLVRLLWSTTPLRDHLVVQLEVIFNSIFLRVLGPAGRQEHEEENVVSHLEVAQRRAILECLMDMLNEPVALVHMYAMFDCDMARTDVLENMFRLLSETVSARAMSLARRGGRGGSGSGGSGGSGGGGGGSDADTHDSIEPTELAAQVEEEEVLRVLPLQCLCAGLRSLHHVIVEDEAAAAESDGPRADSLPEGALSAHDLSSLKFRKSALCKGAQFFNEKSRDGYKELQRLGVLPAPLQPGMVAEFLRGLPSLDKKAVGCYLGESGVMEERVKETTYCTDKASFHASVLDSFVSTFDLTGLSLLASLRTFLSSFRLPGEAQQIDRILVAFSEAAFTQCSDCHLLASSDVAYVLSFSIIMLNTDLHNVNIKEDKKMSLKDFYRNNKNYGADVSKGIDLPEDFLTGIYNGIKTFPFRTLKDGPEGEITPERWGDLLRMNAVMRAAENSIFKRPATTDWSAAAAVYTPQIFALIWSPALAAFSSCMQPGAAGADKTMPVVRSGFAMCTQLSSHFGLQGILDQIVISLCNFSQLLSPVKAETEGSEPEWEMPAGAKTLAAFSGTTSRQACELAVGIVHSFGNDVRGGWEPLLGCLLRLFELRLLPDAIQLSHGHDASHLLPPSERSQLYETIRKAMEATNEGEPVTEEVDDQPRKGGGLFGWLLGGGGESESGSESEGDETDEDGDGEDDGGGDGEGRAGLSPDEQAREDARALLRNSGVSDIVGDSKFHDEKTLVFFIEVLIAGAENRTLGTAHKETKGENNEAVVAVGEARTTEAANQLGVEAWATMPGGGWPALPLPAFAEESSVLCERLLIEVVMCNRFRVMKIWPLLHKHFSCFLLDAELPTFSVEAALCGMLRLLIRLWSREALDGTLTDTLALLLDVSSAKWDVLAPLIVCGVSQLVQTHAASFGPTVWEIVFKVVARSAGHGTANRHGFQMLRYSLNDAAAEMAPPALCCTALHQFVNSSAPDLEMPFGALKMLFALHSRVLASVTASEGASLSKSAWVVVLQCAATCCRDRRSAVQHRALVLLQCMLLDKTASGFKPTEWQAILQEHVFPLAQALAAAGAEAGGTGAQELALVVGLLSEFFSQRVQALAALPTFHEVWTAYIRIVGGCLKLSPSVTESTEGVAQFGAVMRHLRVAGVFDKGADSIGAEMEVLTWAEVDEIREDIAKALRRVGEEGASSASAGAMSL